MVSSRRSSLRPAAAATAATVMAVLGIAGPAADSAGAAGSAHRSTAIVAMGDSIASGEAGGDYEPDSNRFGDWCHRSTHAQVRQVRLPGVETSVNVACSGARTDNVRLGGTSWYSEGPQTERTRQVARADDVKVITLTVGLNDVPF